MCFTVKITQDALKLENRYGAPLAPNALPTGKAKLSGFEHPRMPVLVGEQFYAMQWGLIPEWVKDRDSALEIRTKTLNARGESAFEKPSFREAVRKRRLIVPVESFYEWKHEGKAKAPFEIFPTLEPFLSLAGIWETWISPQTRTPVSTFSILTCDANPLMAEIHNTKRRMPVVVHPDSISEWLRPDLPESRIREFLEPYPDSWLRADCLVNRLF